MPCCYILCGCVFWPKDSYLLLRYPKVNCSFSSWEILVTSNKLPQISVFRNLSLPQGKHKVVSDGSAVEVITECVYGKYHLPSVYSRALHFYYSSVDSSFSPWLLLLLVCLNCLHMLLYVSFWKPNISLLYRTSYALYLVGIAWYECYWVIKVGFRNLWLHVQYPHISILY